MKLIKKINNNFALALDSRGEQIIVEGRGIGFQKMPTELEDLSLITRTYYNTKEQDISLIKSVSEEILNVSEQICEFAQTKIADKLNPNLRFIMADHLDFAIERYKKQIEMKMPLYYDIRFLYQKETEIAEYAIELINRELGIKLPDSEITGIALNIINSETIVDSNTFEGKEDLVNTITCLIENRFNLKIDRKSFSFSRFVSHMEYLLRRAKGNKAANETNVEMYNKLKKEVPKTSDCVDEIATLLKVKGFPLNDEEKLYLMMHVNRLCNREGL